MKVKPPKGRDYLLLKLIGGATKSGVAPDLKKSYNKKECRMKNYKDYTDDLRLEPVQTETGVESAIETICDWAIEIWPEGCYLGDVARQHYSEVTEEELFNLQCAYEGFLAGLND
jgi:hypothetical protein